MKSEQTLVSTFKKNPLDEVRVCLSKFDSGLFFDLRIWVPDKDSEDGEMVATRKGICLRYDLLEDTIKALEKARDSIGKSPVALSETRSLEGQGKG